MNRFSLAPFTVQQMIYLDHIKRGEFEPFILLLEARCIDPSLRASLRGLPSTEFGPIVDEFTESCISMESIQSMLSHIDENAQASHESQRVVGTQENQT